jgi:hypothetical protein
MHLGRLGRGERARDAEVADTALGRGAEPRHDAELREDRIENVGDRRLAVGSRDAEQRGRIVESAVDPCGNGAQRLPRLRCDDHGQPAALGKARPVGIGQDRDCSAVGGGRGERGTVHVSSGKPDIEVTGNDVTRGQADSGDRIGREIAALLECELGHELGERSCDRMFRAQSLRNPIRHR